jgi:hypothetical protein
MNTRARIFVYSFSFLISRIAGFGSKSETPSKEFSKNEDISKAVAELKSKAEALELLVKQLPEQPPPPA